MVSSDEVRDLHRKVPYKTDLKLSGDTLDWTDWCLGEEGMDQYTVESIPAYCSWEHCLSDTDGFFVGPLWAVGDSIAFAFSSLWSESEQHIL